MRTTQPVGRRIWVIAEGYIPQGGTHAADRRFASHETACILNAGDKVAQITITLYFADGEPVGPYRVEVPPRRTLHLRYNDLKDPQPVPRETDYASVIQSSVPVVVQHTRLDSRQAALALMTTMAYASE